MKTTNALLGLGRWQFFMLGLIALAGTPALAQPVINSVRLETTNVVVSASVPAGVRKVTLECRERLGRGSWEPRAVARVDGTGGTVTFRVPRSRGLEVMRIRADMTEPVPASFFGGTSEFYGASASGPGPVGAATFLDMVGPGVANPPGAENGRAVVESDIWKMRGETLYFFNQLRGLQIIDVTNPDAAVVRGTLELPAAGEEMYLLGSEDVVLLAREGCSGDSSQVLVVRDNHGTPGVLARVPVPGYIQESRLVGTALYVASQSARPVSGTTNTVWEWGTVVSSFDLSNPAAPIARSTLWYSGYGNVVTANDRLLFVVTQDPGNWWQSILRSIDITAPDGTMRAYESIRTEGRVADKFKLHWSENVLTSISEDWRSVPGRRVTTKLETFRLPDPRSAGPSGVSKLGTLELGRGEQLHATRFDGHLVYIVTFFQIDPLWVVDLSNPSTPRIAGSVEVPGWSSFIQPLGSRLVTVGVETNRVAVSLFDVANPSAPTLLSRVRLGENYSYSEANWDEQAFSVLEEAGLILVPFTGDTTNGYASRVQLIDLNSTTLVARGLIEQELTPRRATLYANRVLSISGWELLSVDPTDRDHPVVRGQTLLAFPVDRVFVEGNHLVEIGGTTTFGWWGGGSSKPVLRVTSADAPNQVLQTLNLVDLPVLGADVRGGKLYLAQGQNGFGGFGPILLAAEAGGTNAVDPPRSKLLLTVIDVAHLPAIAVLGQSEAEVSGFGFGGDLQAVWPRPDVLVWSGGGFNYWWWGDVMPLAADFVVGWPWFPRWGGSGGKLVAFDVSNSALPELASEVDVSTNNWWSFSRAFTANSLVYLSHQTSEFVPRVPPVENGAANAPVDAAIGGQVIIPDPIGEWVTRSFLDVVDYGDARHPLVRQPVSVPGALNGLSHEGSVIYTVGTRWTTNTLFLWDEFLDASAYDGVAAHLVDSLPLADSWTRPILVTGTNVFLGRTGGVGTNRVETWFLSDAGRFSIAGRVNLTSPASVLQNFGALLTVRQTDNEIALFDATHGAALRLVGQSRPIGCLWFDLNHADGELGRGLWLPLGAYGVAKIPAGP